MWFLILVANDACRAKRLPWKYDFPEVTAQETTQVSKYPVTDESLFIPVVFHIVYNDEVQNISNAQVLSQLEVINEDFNLNNSNLVDVAAEFKSLATSVDIQFYLVDITRTATSHGPFINDDLHLTSKGGRDAVNTKQFLNVWVANLGSGIFGYASSPDSEAFRDGIAIHYEYFGRSGSSLVPYDQGRTLTHEIGHWLGLQHLWGNGGCDSDDGLSDTPTQDTALSGCQLAKESCGSLDMVQNFMNTSEDACLALFTPQQREAMRTTLFNDRPEVYGFSAPITGINKKIEANLLNIYPNPITDGAEVQIKLPNNEPIQEVRLLNLNGNEIRQYKPFNTIRSMSIDLTGLENGMYIAQVNEYTAKIYLNIQ